MSRNQENIALLIARTSARLNRPALGRLIGRSGRWVQRVELGDGYARLTPEIREKLAAALDTPESILFPEVGGDK
jgi:transcriptional regulator with XRE-family HTH domain